MPCYTVDVQINCFLVMCALLSVNNPHKGKILGNQSNAKMCLKLLHMHMKANKLNLLMLSFTYIFSGFVASCNGSMYKLYIQIDEGLFTA